MELVGSRQEDIEFTAKERRASVSSLKEIFDGCLMGDIQVRNQAIWEAVVGNGHKQKDVAAFLGLHYTQIRRIIGRIREEV